MDGLIRIGLVNAKTLARVEDQTHDIQQMTDKTFMQLRKTERVLMRAMFEATEANTPTCFVIVNAKLSVPVNADVVEECEGVREVSEEENFAMIVTKMDVWMNKLSCFSSSVSSALTKAADLTIPDLQESLMD